MAFLRASELRSFDQGKQFPHSLRCWAGAFLFVLAGILFIDLATSLSHRRPPLSQSFELVAHALANSIGFIELRPGYLARHAEQIQGLEAKLQPLDILVISAPFKGTSFFTPGHNTHMAVWMGDESSWQLMPSKSDPKLQSLLKEIQDGNALLQADRSGVALSQLSSITSADEITIYRSRTPLDLATHLETILANLGKAYDYNLDGLDDTKLICTELVYSIFPQIPVEMTNRLGRTFIIPDGFKRGLDKSENWQSIFYAGPQR